MTFRNGNDKGNTLRNVKYISILPSGYGNVNYKTVMERRDMDGKTAVTVVQDGKARAY